MKSIGTFTVTARNRIKRNETMRVIDRFGRVTLRVENERLTQRRANNDKINFKFISANYYP